MNANRFTLDTNLLIYAIDRDAGTRHQQAITLVDQAVEQDCVLSMQVLAEFFHAVTRKGKMPLAEASEQVRDWQILFPMVAADGQALLQAMSAVQHHHLPFWDALLWATAKAAGVHVLLSEDFQDGRELEGVRFRNPFAVEDPFAIW
ncbi:MAG: PIN domain-containing protein [Candidatus Competibacteraceae bacterium]|jgi:predicted nucleic acid-binding protein|nr:PIN domain-containing protein [Candidatus Competibacteraceae bacterium]